MTPTKLIIKPERTWTWDHWQAGRAKLRRVGNLVAPKNIRRKKSEGDEYLCGAYAGESGPKFNKAFDPSAREA